MGVLHRKGAVHQELALRRDEQHLLRRGGIKGDGVIAPRFYPDGEADPVALLQPDAGFPILKCEGAVRQGQAERVGADLQGGPSRPGGREGRRKEASAADQSDRR